MEKDIHDKANLTPYQQWILKRNDKDIVVDILSRANLWSNSTGLEY